MGRAPRQPARPWRRQARGALLGLGLCLTATGGAGAQHISGAEYAGPTDAYPHGVLGDDLEWSELHVTVSRESGEAGSLSRSYMHLTYRVPASENAVFEDLEPRLWDVTGDGQPEVVVVESHQKHGARLVILGLVDGLPESIAATPYIGRRFRWLAPVGAADLDGDGHVEIAYVDRPHLAKTLRVWRFRDGEFTRIATADGLSNHKIGWDHIPGGIRDCGAGPEVITADESWRRIMASSLRNRAIATREIGPYTGPDSLDAALTCP